MIARREFLVQPIVLAAAIEQAVVSATLARAQAVGSPNRLFEIEQVAEGVYAATARPVAVLNCNAAIFVNTNDVLVVDAHSKPSAAAALVAQIRREVTPKPVRYIVSTHFHWDHVQGLAAYRSLKPSPQLLASAATGQSIASLATQRLKESLDSTRAQMEMLKSQQPRTEAERVWRARTIAEIERYQREMTAFQPELPDITFDSNLVLRDKAHEIHLLFRGRAHTSGDVVVFCPQKKVIATGDLLHGFVPYMTDGYPFEWAPTLRRFGELDFTAVVGGHGPVQRTRDRLHQTAAYIDEITEAVSRRKQSGGNLEELQRTVTPATLRTLADSDYGRFVQESLKRYLSFAPGEDPAAEVAKEVRVNVADIWKRLEAGT